MDLDSKDMRHFIEGMPKVVKNQISIFSYKYGKYYCHLLSFVYGVKGNHHSIIEQIVRQVAHIPLGFSPLGYSMTMLMFALGAVTSLI